MVLVCEDKCLPTFYSRLLFCSFILFVMNDFVMVYIISLCKRGIGAAGKTAQSIKCLLCKCEDMFGFPARK